MTNAETGTLVLKNQAGDYFLVPQETLERGRVPAEHTAEVEEAIAGGQGGTGGDDVEGYALVFIVGFVIGFTLTKAALEDSSEITTGQMIQGAVDQARGAAVRPPA